MFKKICPENGKKKLKSRRRGDSVVRALLLIAGKR